MAVQAPYRTTVTVIGMTCQICAMSISEEIGEIPGVSAVDARLDSGVVTVLADREVGHIELVAAVIEAGFEVAG